MPNGLEFILGRLKLGIFIVPAEACPVLVAGFLMLNGEEDLAQKEEVLLCTLSVRPVAITVIRA